MKILLVGEYSRLHNSLKEGLIKLGHQVEIIGSRDHFKNFSVDILIDSPLCKRFLPTIIKKGFHKLFKIDLCDFEKMCRLQKHISELKNYDVVQLINEDAFAMKPQLQYRYLKKLFKQNKNIFLLSCGDDFVSINYYLKNIDKYSILTPYLLNPNFKKKYNFSLKYVTKPYKKLHNYIYKHINGVIASDLDYHLPLQNHMNYLGLIPNPINTNALNCFPLDVTGKIIIFHGINARNYIKKGNRFFDEALDIITSKYSNRIEIVKTIDLPYNVYIEKYNQAHIILDQVYAFDQGYNALEAMAKGKVVFTGAEQEWLDYYNLKEDTIAINAIPNAENIAKKLEWLILNPKVIQDISKNAVAFIEREHHHVDIAKKYLETWKHYSSNS